MYLHSQAMPAAAQRPAGYQQVIAGPPPTAASPQLFAVAGAVPASPQLGHRATAAVRTSSVGPTSPLRTGSRSTTPLTTPRTAAGVVVHAVSPVQIAAQGIQVVPTTPQQVYRSMPTYTTAAAGYPTAAASTATAAPVPSGADKTSFPRALKVGGYDVSLEGRLGSGSFGTVFKGKASKGNSGERQVAVKEIQCKSAKEKAQAEYEGKLMRLVSEDFVDPLVDSPKTRSARRLSFSMQRCACPRLYAMETKMSGANAWEVTIVMERVYGMPIDEFAKEQSNKREYACAMRLALDLLHQVGPMLERVAPLCVHRDVNAHNILLHPRSNKDADDDDSSAVTSPDSDIFTLIDFGLASDAKGWQNGDWKTENIGGDCRYWPTSCWKQFLFGYKYLLADPVDVEEYVHNLDSHSLALTCLQILSEVTTGTKPAHAVPLFNAFSTYWTAAVKFHSELFAVFSGQGSWAALKKSFLQQQIVETTRRNLDRVKSALEQCASQEDAQVAAFLRVLKKMISGRHTEWTDLQKILQGVKPQAAPFEKASGLSVLDRSTPAMTAEDIQPAAAAPKKFSHRRQHTADNSMSRDVPEVGAVGRPEGESDKDKQTFTSPTARPSALKSSGSSNRSTSATPGFSHRRVRSTGLVGPSAGGVRFSTAAQEAGEDGIEDPQADGDLASTTASTMNFSNFTADRLRKITEKWDDEMDRLDSTAD